MLPPGVVHDGQPAPGARSGFWKRKLYLEPDFLPESLIGAAVDKTTIDDPQLRQAISGLHDSLLTGEGPVDGESRLALIAERLLSHLQPRHPNRQRPETDLAVQLRHYLDERTRKPVALADAATLMDRSVPHLVRSFSSAFGVSPHVYLIGRRIEAARGMLLQGMAPAEVATTVGFYDQAHLTRHFKRHNTSPLRPQPTMSPPQPVVCGCAVTSVIPR